jgi:hypothetical protein
LTGNLESQNSADESNRGAGKKCLRIVFRKFLLVEALYLTRYTEHMGTKIQDMLKRCKIYDLYEHDLLWWIELGLLLNARKEYNRQEFRPGLRPD